MAEPSTRSWKINQAGKLPIVYELTLPYGEAPTFATTIRCENGHLFKIDFGYGHPNDLACALLIGAATKLRDACQFIVDITDEELQLTKPGSGAEVALRHVNRRAREALQAARGETGET